MSQPQIAHLTNTFNWKSLDNDLPEVDLSHLLPRVISLDLLPLALQNFR
jgi:hypothetical protein